VALGEQGKVGNMVELIQMDDGTNIESIYLYWTMRTVALMCIAGSLAMIGRCQTPHQSVITIPDGYSGELSALVPMGDGSRVCVFPDGTNSFVLRRFNGSGQHVWSKRVISPVFANAFPQDWYRNPFVADGEGGLYYCATAQRETSADGIGTDTLRISTALLHIDSLGQPISHHSIWNQIEGSWVEVVELDNYQRAELAVHPDGSLFVLVQKRGQATQTFQLDRINALGSLDWSRTYYLPGSSPAHGPVGDDGPFYCMVPDLLGGAYYLNHYVRQLYHFDADGHCEWAYQYHYGPDSASHNSVEIPELVVDPDTHDAVLIGDRVTDLGRRQLFLKVAVNGGLLSADLCEYPASESIFNQYVASGGLGANGEIISCQWGFSSGRVAFSALSPGNDQIMRYRADAEVHNGSVYSCQWRRANVVSSHVQLYGVAQVTDVFGISETHPILTDLSLPDVDGCLFTPLSNSNLSAMAIMSAVDKPLLLDVITQPPHEMELSELPVVVDVPAPAVADLCSFDTALPPSSDERTGGPATTILAAGESVRYAAICDGRLRILDQLGRTLAFRGLHAGSFTDISTNGWPGGVILFDWRPLDGSAGQADRVVLR